MTITSRPFAELTPVFDRVYGTSRWTEAGNGSGPGSALGPGAPLVQGLIRAIDRFGIRSIVDVSCGGMAWWPHVLNQRPDVSFHGFDVSGVVIRRNRQRFGSFGWLFDVADARRAQYPKADLIVCRQTLNHLWLEDAAAVVENLLPLAGILAVTHDPGLISNGENADRRTLFPDCDGATCYERLNMLKPPFPALEPLARLADVEEQVLALFRGKGCLPFA